MSRFENSCMVREFLSLLCEFGSSVIVPRAFVYTFNTVFKIVDLTAFEFMLCRVEQSYARFFLLNPFSG